jgi:ankyrin repeat protein
MELLRAALAPLSFFAFNPVACGAMAVAFACATFLLKVSLAKRVLFGITALIWIGLTVLEATTPIQTNIRVDLVFLLPFAAFFTLLSAGFIVHHLVTAEERRLEAEHDAMVNAARGASRPRVLTPSAPSLQNADTPSESLQRFLQWAPKLLKLGFAVAVIGWGAFALSARVAQRGDSPPMTYSDGESRDTPTSKTRSINLSPTPFVIDGFDSSGFALEAQLAGTFAVEAGYVVIRPSTALRVRRSSTCVQGPQCESVLSGVRLLIAQSGDDSFSTIAESGSLDPNHPLPKTKDPFSVVLPKEIRFALRSFPTDPLDPALGKIRLKIELAEPGEYDDERGSKKSMRQYATNYTEAPASFIPRAFVGERWSEFCKRVWSLADAVSIACAERVRELAYAQPEQVNARVDGRCNPLALAIIDRDREMIDTLLDAGAKPQPKSPNCSETLWWGVMRGDASLVKALIAKGADPGRSGRDDYSPLASAVDRGNVEIVKVLLDAGANPNVMSPKNYIVLAIAVRANRADMVDALLAAKADPNFPIPNPGNAFYDGRNVLWWSMPASHNGVREMLLRAGANPMQSTPNGFNELLEAAAMPGLDALKMMLAHGADINAPGKHDYFKGVTPFMNTAVRAHVRDMEEMIRLGANPYTVDHRGKDAIYWAEHFGRKDNAVWLKKKLGR